MHELFTGYKKADHKLRTIISVCILLLTGILMTACGSGLKTPGKVSSSSAPAEGAQNDADDMDDQLQAVDTVIVVAVDTDSRIIILQNSAGGSRYELSFDGRTGFFNKYGSALSAAQINPGDIADIRLSVHSGYLRSLTLSDQAFSFKKVADYKINENKKMFSMGNDNYRLPERLIVILDGQVGGIRDICEGDILTVSGIGRTVLTCAVEMGHGYVKIRGQERFVGGWIEAGSMILPVSDNMLLTVPEGEREIRISYKGRGGKVMVDVPRDGDVSVDVSPLEDTILQMGRVNFKIKPSFAKLEINGEETEHLLPVELEYGMYRVRVSCEGYRTFESRINVKKPEGELPIELEMEEEGREDETSSSDRGRDLGYVVPPAAEKSAASSSASSPKKTSSSTAAAKRHSSSKKSTSSSSERDDEPYLFINEPFDCEVYFDGAYKGVSPIGFKKEEGTHVVTLSRDGYGTKSYTLTLEGRRDETFDFPELVKRPEMETDDEEVSGEEPAVADDEVEIENADEADVEEYNETETVENGEDNGQGDSGGGSADSPGEGEEGSAGGTAVSANGS